MMTTHSYSYIKGNVTTATYIIICIPQWKPISGMHGMRVRGIAQSAPIMYARVRASASARVRTYVRASCVLDDVIICA